jgi:hypothetical protein
MDTDNVKRTPKENQGGTERNRNLNPNTNKNVGQNYLRQVSQN